MTRRTVATLKTIRIHASHILKQDAHIANVATHEAAHFLAAIARDVAICEVWVKGRNGSGQTIRTRGSDGRINTLPFEINDDAFVSYAGYAWEERHGDIVYAASDFAYAEQAGVPEELGNARKLVQKHEIFIRHIGAAMIELRDSRGWIRREKLKDLCFWTQCRYNDSIRRQKDFNVPSSNYST
jgi:hypothetical protein